MTIQVRHAGVSVSISSTFHYNPKTFVVPSMLFVCIVYIPKNKIIQKNVIKLTTLQILYYQPLERTSTKHKRIQLQLFYFPLHFLLQRIHESDFKASKNDAPHNYKTNSHVDAEHERTHLKNNKLYDTKIPEKRFQKTKEKGRYLHLYKYLLAPFSAHAMLSIYAYDISLTRACRKCNAHIHIDVDPSKQEYPNYLYKNIFFFYLIST